MLLAEFICCIELGFEERLNVWRNVYNSSEASERYCKKYEEAMSIFKKNLPKFRELASTFEGIGNKC